jgi:DNA sulfur modification protein DndB
MCVVYRKALDVSGNSAKAYQRMVNKKRLPKIAEFIAQPDSILPVNIIVHLSDDVEITPLKMDDLKSTTGSKVKFTKNNTDLVRINIPMRYASLELVDGQHRLFGFSQSHYEELIKNYNLVVLGIRELTEANKTKTFVAINDNSRRMDANLVAFLKYTDDESICQRDNKLMAIKIVYELNKQHPFLNTIRLVDVGDQKITLKGFSGYDLQGLVGDRGYLRKYYLLNDSKEYISVLRMYFSLIKETFEVEWKDPNRYIISTNRGISAFLKLLKAILRHEGKQLDKSIIQKYMKALKSNWNNTWVTSDLKASYVGSQGWSNLYKDISTAIRKTIKDF